MQSLVRPELPTASVGSSQAPTAAVDNSAPLQPARSLCITRGKAVHESRATSLGGLIDNIPTKTVKKAKLPLFHGS